MAIGRENLGLGFDISGNPADALRAFDKIEDEADRLKAKLKALSGREVFKLDIKGDFKEADINSALKRDALKSFDKDLRQAAGGMNAFGAAARGSRSDVGQFIGAIAQGDPAEVLQEIAQAGGAAGAALAAVTLIVAGAAVGLGLLTKAVIENSREVSQLARDYKLTATQVQSLQSLAIITGESVDDLAENFKKVAPQAKILEEQIKATGAEIDDGLRHNTQDALVAFEGLHIAATGAMNDIARGALPQVVALMSNLNALLTDNRDLWQGIGTAAGVVLEFVSAGIQALNQSLLDFNTLMADVGTLGITFAARTVSNFNNQDTFGGADFGDNSLFSIPGFKKAKSGGAGKKDIGELEKELRILRTAEAEARDLLDGRREALEAYLEARRKVFEVERQLAEKELPNEKAAKLAEIQQREVAATREYFEALEKLNKEAVEAAQKDVADRIRVQQQRLEEERKFLNELKTLDLERNRIDLDRRAQSLQRDRELGVRNTADITGNTAGVLRLRELALERDTAKQVFAERAEQHRRELEQSESNFADQEQLLEVQKRINAKFRAEEQFHLEQLAAIKAKIRQEKERQDPLSARSLLGDNFANNLELFDGNKIEAMAATAAGAFDSMSASAGNFATIAADAFGTFAKGIASTVESFVLLGTTGPAVLKKMTAQVLAQVAAQASVKAIFELAEGFALLFVNPIAAGAHFKAAALYGAVAVAAGVAGRAIAGDSFKQGGGAGASGQGQGGARNLIIEQGLNGNQRAQEPRVIHLRGEYAPGIIVREVTNDINRNGQTRTAIRSDIAGEGFSIV